MNKEDSKEFYAKYTKGFMYFILIMFSGCVFKIATKSPDGIYKDYVSYGRYFIEINDNKLCEWMEDRHGNKLTDRNCYTISSIKKNDVKFYGKMYDRYVVDNHFDFMVTGNWFSYNAIRQLNSRGTTGQYWWR